MRGKRVRARPEELGPADSASRAARREREREVAPLRPEALRGREGDIEEPVSPEINLIGQRVEPALEQLDAYIDQRAPRLPHGGAGDPRPRLRQAAAGRARAPARPPRRRRDLRAGAPNEGGNGATVVSFRTA